VKIDDRQQKIKINRKSNFRGSCQSIFSLSRHHPMHQQKIYSKVWTFFYSGLLVLVGATLSPSSTTQQILKIPFAKTPHLLSETCVAHISM